jgi:hypothetical protein
VQHFYSHHQPSRSSAWKMLHFNNLQQRVSAALRIFVSNRQERRKKMKISLLTASRQCLATGQKIELRRDVSENAFSKIYLIMLALLKRWD